MEKDTIRERIQGYFQHYSDSLPPNSFQAYGRRHFRCVLFDMDGVLYDSMPNHAIAWQESMHKFGLEMTEADAYLTEGQRGVDTIRQMVKAQKGIDIDEAEAQRMYDEKARIFGELGPTSIMPGVMLLMKRIKAADMQIGIVTGSGQRPLIKRLLNDFAEYVDESHIVTAYDVEHGKPAPDPYLMGLKRAGGLLPSQAIVVENAPLGVRAGVAAGIFTIAVNSGPLPDDMLVREGAGLVFDNMDELCSNWYTIVTSHPTRNDTWEEKCQEIINFILRNKRCPSKHREEDMPMINWLKYNRRMRNAGRLSEYRLSRLAEITELAHKYRRLNSTTYLHHIEED